MYRIAKIPIEERETLFRNTARKMRVAEAIVEKDFWVLIGSNMVSDSL